MTWKISRAILVLVALGMVLMPPWIEVYTAETGSFARSYHGYHAVWNKPADRKDRPSQGVRIWSSRLSQQLIGLGALALILHRTLRTRSRTGIGQEAL